MSFSELVASADFAIKNSRPMDAVPLLKEILARAGKLSDNSAKESLQMARLQLGIALNELQKTDEAKQYLNAYLSSEPCKDRTAALQTLCRIALGKQDWKALDTAAQQILEDKSLSLRSTETAEQFLVQAVFNLGNYNKTLELLPGVIERAKNPENIRSYRIMQVRCLFETDQIDQLITTLPLLFRGDARDDVSLNLTLLRIGDQLFDRGQYRKSLAVYRLVMPKPELLTRQKQRLAQQEAEADKKTIWKITELRQALQTLEKVPDYDVHIAYRAAQIYSEQKRFWEAVVLFEQLSHDHPQREEGKAAFFQKLLLLYELGQNDEAVALSTDYLEKNRSGLYPRMVCIRLMQHYLQNQQMDDALALVRYADRWSPAANDDEREQETGLRYMVSFVRFQRGEYDDAVKAFDEVIRTAPNSQAGIDSHYWQAMCRLLQQNYQQAYELFGQYRQKWPRASYAPAALFRMGVCRFGVEDYDGAKTTFKKFIDEYAEDALFPEALSMYGDLLGGDGRLDEALACYRQAVSVVKKNYREEKIPAQKAQAVLPATYAVFQAARTLEADAESYEEAKEPQTARSKYQELIDLVEDYKSYFAENADWAQSVFWVGKAETALGEKGRAIQAYLDALIQYGSDPAQEGVSAILFDLAEMIRNAGDQVSAEDVTEKIQAARTNAKSRTLRIRLDVLLAELNGRAPDLGRRLLETEKDLTPVPPSGLALMCAALLEQKDYSRSTEFFDYFTAHYDASPFMKNAYRLRAEDLYLQKRYDDALPLALETLGLYGADADTGWAQLMKGNIELIRGDYTEAEKTFNAIFNVRAWRGSVSAEAMLRMAQSWYQQGNYEKAFAFFQRTYLLYKAYDGGRWAADAYLMSADCLRHLGRDSAARNTYRAMLLDEYVRDLPQAETAKTALGPQETAELLAGRTNTMETVEAEVKP